MTDIPLQSQYIFPANEVRFENLFHFNQGYGHILYANELFNIFQIIP
jgi:hypothetical protein